MFKIRATLVMLILLLLIAAGYLYSLSQGEKFSCTAYYVQHSQDAKMDLFLSYSFGKRRGLLCINGKMHLADGETKNISRRVLFNYKRENQYYMLTSESSIRTSSDTVDNPTIKKNLSDFYVESGKSMFMRIVYQRSGQYFFYNDPVIAYSCKKN
ncbi:hypothetical protein [Pantoea sp. 1.19]|uniref:hypothetical protein n=1 Tax=Pantoea sp. 1.19 TaxID=1925589 RepID=UPI000948B549|nr:hypothetical protein [Pantoea sp. 1.19]